ncbi:hypothetical protein VPH35_133600 [Triticum aestivum]
MSQHHRSNHLLEGSRKLMVSVKWQMKYFVTGKEFVSVWGIVGVGKSALVRNLYDDYKASKTFTKYSWVDVSHPFDLSDFCRSILLDCHPEMDPIEECRKLLDNNECLLVIDDIQCMQEWDMIETTLLSIDSPVHSVIVVITTEASIAYHASSMLYEFHVRALEADAAIDLFQTEVHQKNPSSAVANYMDSHHVQIQELVLKCGGLPKVIVAIADVLARQPFELMQYNVYSLYWTFMNSLETKPEYDNLQGLFGWLHSYFRTCPDSLKPCIFYLAIFPRRRRLVRRWIAEGYTRDSSQESAEHNGEVLFSDLHERSIIHQPPQKIATATLDGPRMAICQVNGFIHEYIVARRMDENLFELEGNSALTTQRTGRHLVIFGNWNRDRIVFKSIDFSRLRSLTVFGKWEPFFISKGMKILRVLDLEDARGMKDADLEKMVNLLPRLKFLSLRGCREICHLPSSLGDLRQLQTLDVRGTSIVTLPENITLLQKLQYIRAGSGSGTKEKTSSMLNLTASAPPISSCWLPELCKRRQLVGVVVPGGIGKLTALHTLGVVNVAASGGKAILEELKKLTQLRKLGVSGINKKNSNEFFSAIKEHVHLESLSVQLNKDTSQVCLDGTPLPLENLQSLKLYGLVNVQLQGRRDGLRKLHLEMATIMEDDIKFLGKLPLLCVLRVKQIQDGELHFHVVVDGQEEDSLGSVKVLQIACGCSSSSLHVTFGSKSMKELELLKVDCHGGSPPYQFSGLENLVQLKQILLVKCSNAEALKGQLESQLAEHPNKPVVKLEEPPQSS